MADQPKLDLNLDTGKLSKFLGIKTDDSIDMDLLKALLSAKIPPGEHSVTVKNPSKLGNKSYTLTDNKADSNYIGSVHQMVNFAINAKSKWGA